MDHIYKNVYIGDSHDARNLAPQIAAVLNVADDLDVRHDPRTTIAVKVGLGDSVSTDVTEGPQAHAKMYIMAADALKMLSRANQTVLVHCHEGISRSSAVVALWLVQEHGFSLHAALKLIRAKRKAALERVRQTYPRARIPHACHERMLRQLL